MKKQNSVGEYMRREIETIRVLLTVISETPTPAALTDIAVDRLTLAAQRLEQSLQYLARGA